MIVKVVKAREAGTGRGLATYILAATHTHYRERLGDYKDDPQTIEKIEWAQHANINAPTPLAAISAIETYNAQNIRKHRVSRWEHIVVSFKEGERPTEKQVGIIEDRLLQAIGFGDHPRISAVHSNTRDALTGGYRHLHIAVSRIDPKTLKAEHPRGNFFKLQAEAARLEIELGLSQERKNLLTRERREIDARIAFDRGEHHLLVDNSESDTSEGGQMFEDLQSAFKTAWEQGSIRAGIDDWQHSKFAREQAENHYAAAQREQRSTLTSEKNRDERIFNAEKASQERGEAFFEAHANRADYPPREKTTPRPALAHQPEQKITIEFTREELSVLVREATPSIHPGVSERIFDKLVRATTDIASAPQTQTAAVELTRAELFKVILDHEVREDIKPLRPDIAENITTKLERAEDRILASERFISHQIQSEAELSGLSPRRADGRMQPWAEKLAEVSRKQHQRAKATPEKALYARYKSERDVAVGVRKQAEQAVYDRFSTYQQDLRGFFDLRREQEKLNARQPHRINRQNAHELLGAERRGARVEARQLRAQQLAAARREHPLPTWDAFLTRESERGDKEATRLLNNRAREMQRQREQER